MFGLLLAAYKDLQSREDTRNAVWQQEGWHEVVYYTGEQISVYYINLFQFIMCITFRFKVFHNIKNDCILLSAVPLIQRMDSRIMIPTKASPLQ